MPVDPEFAALLCLYHNNDAGEVAEAIHSTFFDQTKPPALLIVVFDGPVPQDVAEVIARTEEQVPVTRIVFNENRGHGPARAAGIAACPYPWIAILDADDLSLPHRFESLLAEIAKDPEVAVIGGALQEFTVADGVREVTTTRSYPQTHAEITDYLRSRSPIAQPTAMLRVAAILDVGNYQSWFNNEDYHLWIRLVSAGYRLRNIAKPVLLFRTSPHLYDRRGGWRYWRNEVALQQFSLQNGTTTWVKFLQGAAIRFVVQVAMPNKLRQAFYKLILRRA